MKFKFRTLSIFLLIFCCLLASCKPPANSAQMPPGQNPAEFIINTVMFIVASAMVYYMLVTKPQALKAEEREKFVKALTKNDEVSIAGGILGRVAAVRDDFVSVEIAPNVKVRVLPNEVYPVKKAVKTVAPSGGANLEKSKAAKGK